MLALCSSVEFGMGVITLVLGLLMFVVLVKFPGKLQNRHLIIVAEMLRDGNGAEMLHQLLSLMLVEFG